MATKPSKQGDIMTEVFASAKFVRDNNVKEVQVIKTKRGYICRHINNGVVQEVSDFARPVAFKNVDDAITKMGTESLAGWRNLLTMARWEEII
jgi:hypothetical protein